MQSGSNDLLRPSDAVSAADSDENPRASTTTESSRRTLDDTDNKGVLRKHHGIVYIWINWKWEILAYMLVLGTPFFMLATIYPHEGQPLPQWPFRITINALLSIYGVVLKASLGFLVASCLGQLQWNWFTARRPLYDVVLYNQAAQSAWGSLVWIWWHQMEQPLATMGCVILILSIALDPFIQQLVRPVDCQVVVHGQARLPRTNVNYDSSGWKGAARDLDRALKRAGISSSSDIDVVCPTGNCTFSETYGTLGYCSHCEDSSAELTRRSTCLTEDGHELSLHPSRESDCPENSNWTILSSLPESWHPISWLNDTLSFSSLNITRTVLDGIWDAPIPAEVAVMDRVCNTSENSRPEQIMVQILVDELIRVDDLGIDVLTLEDFWGAANCGGANATTWRCRGHGAATCSLSPCVRLYNATVENGRLTERLVDDSGGVFWGETWGATRSGSGLALLDTECLSPEEMDIVKKFHVKIEPGQRWAWLESVPHLTGKPSQGYTSATWIQKLLERKCLYYMIDSFAREKVPDVLGRYLSGSLVGNTFLYPLYFQGGQVLEDMIDNGRIDMARIESAMANISEAMTRFMRTHGHASYSEDALGQVTHYATCIEAQWFWIILPGILALMTLVILVLVIATANARRRPVWKGSPLVWIIRGVDGYEPGGQHSDLKGAPTLADLEKTSKQTIISVT